MGDAGRNYRGSFSSCVQFVPSPASRELPYRGEPFPFAAADCRDISRIWVNFDLNDSIGSPSPAMSARTFGGL